MNLKNCEASGSDDIPIELLNMVKKRDTILQFNICQRKDEYMPKSRNEAIITMAHKIGNKSNS